MEPHAAEALRRRRLADGACHLHGRVPQADDAQRRHDDAGIERMVDLWRLYMGHLQTVAQPWMKSWQQTPGHLGVAMAGEGGSELIDLTRLYWNAYDQTMGSITGMPGVGFTRELEEKLAKGFASWQQAVQAMNEYQLLMADAWSGVHEQVLREMMTLAEQGKPIQSIRDLVKLWTGAADKSFDEIFRSEKYAQVQGAFVRTYMEYRIHEQQIVDEMMKYSHIPTRTEMDEAHRNIYELRREVKALKKALRETEATNGTGKKAASSSSSSSKKSTPPARPPRRCSLNPPPRRKLRNKIRKEVYPCSRFLSPFRYDRRTPRKKLPN
ncbi:MAG: class III poly(R)-hydroxyalkanoic acid synthase subunit PhaE [Chloroflexaceae bacterium]|nr:class III poly(R)-hydroxyalkanoic acid synthase subunit PhaE [Chloroflexaceae bacterium]